MGAVKGGEPCAKLLSEHTDQRLLSGLTLQRAAGSEPSFETTARNKETVTYIAWSAQSSSVMHIADIHISADVAPGAGTLDFDRDLTRLSDAAGLHERSAANGGLRFDAPGRHRSVR